MSMERKSIFSYYIPLEYRSLADDLLRMITLQFSANLLFNFSNPHKYPILGYDFIRTLLFIIIGISLYWLVIRKLIIFDNPSAPYREEKFYYGGT